MWTFHLSCIRNTRVTEQGEMFFVCFYLSGHICFVTYHVRIFLLIGYSDICQFYVEKLIYWMQSTTNAEKANKYTYKDLNLYYKF